MAGVEQSKAQDKLVAQLQDEVDKLQKSETDSTAHLDEVKQLREEAKQELIGELMAQELQTIRMSRGGIPRRTPASHG